MAAQVTLTHLVLVRIKVPQLEDGHDWYPCLSFTGGGSCRGWPTVFMIGSRKDGTPFFRGSSRRDDLPLRLEFFLVSTEDSLLRYPCDRGLRRIEKNR